MSTLYLILVEYLSKLDDVRLVIQPWPQGRGHQWWPQVWAFNSMSAPYRLYPEIIS